MALVGVWLAGEVLVLSPQPGGARLLAARGRSHHHPTGRRRAPARPGRRRLLGRAGLRWFLAGSWSLAVVSISVLLVSGVTSHYPSLGLILLCIGFGAIDVIFGGTVAGSTGVRNDQQGVAGALVNAARQMGAAIDSGPAAPDLGQSAGYRLALMCWAGIGVAAALLSLALPGLPRPEREPAPTLEPAPARS